MRDLVVEIIGRAEGFTKATAEAEGKADSLGSKLGGMGKTAALAAGAAGIGAVVATLHAGVGDWEESTKVTALTDAALKATGGTAGMTGKSIDDLAESIQRKTGIDHNAIQAGENMLLHYTNVRNEVGKGNDIFNQATKTASDLSTALGIEMPAASKLLGKALEDPEKATGALKKAGVVLTEAQKDQIKAFKESGHTMEAQKVILEAVHKRYGDASEAVGKTLPGQLKIAKAEFTDFAGKLVGAVMPALTGVVSIGTKVTGFLSEHKTIAEILMGVLGAFAVVLGAVKLATLAKAAADGIATAATTVWSGVTKGAEAAQWLFNAALDANPIGIVVLAIGAIVAALVIFGGHTKQVGKIFGDVFSTIKDVVGDVIGWVKSHWMLILAIVTGPIGLAVLFVTKHFAAIKGIIGDVVHTVSGWFGALVHVVTWPFVQLGSIASGVFKGIKGGISDAIGFIKTVWHTITSVLTAPFQAVISFVKGIPGTILAFIKSAINGVIDLINDFTGTFKVKIDVGPVHINTGRLFPAIPHLAAGGPLSAGQLALVGEQGPELWQPSTAGNVIPINSARSQQPIEVPLIVDGHELARVAFDPMRKQATQFKQRTNKVAFA